jgi:hypothetical protein
MGSNPLMRNRWNELEGYRYWNERDYLLLYLNEEIRNRLVRGDFNLVPYFVNPEEIEDVISKM